MVFERIINPDKVEGKPWEMFFLGIVFATLAIVLSLWIFKNQASIIMVTLTTIASIPIVSNLIKREETKDLTTRSERKLLTEHNKAIMALLFLFLGFTVTFLAFHTFMPQETSEKVFNVQHATINERVEGSTENLIGDVGLVTGIVANNMKILLLCIIFSFFYGAGAIFILTWNASVMGVVIGNAIKTCCINNGVVSSSLIGLGRYLLHGIPEIGAYFVGALAAGMISFAIIKHDYDDDNFPIIMKDSLDLILISILLIVVSALIEVYLTPVFF